MVSLLEIEYSAPQPSLKEREEWLPFLAESLREERSVRSLAPRGFTTEQIELWIAEDEVDMKSLRAEA